MGASETKAKSNLTTPRRERLWTVLLLSVGISLLLYIVGPLEIFAGNLAEFQVPLSSFIFWLLLVFILGVGLRFVVLYFVPEKGYRILLALTAAFFLLLFLQTTYLNFSYNSLPGDGMENPAQNVGVIIADTSIWVVVLIAFILAMIFVKKHSLMPTICLVLSLALLVTQLVSLLTACVTTKGLANDRYVKTEQAGMTFLSTQNLTNISQAHNVFVFCVDRFDGLAYAEPIMDSNPDIFRNLTGFTYFKDHTAIYGHTYPAVTTMITNVSNNPNQTREEYFAQAYAQNTTIKTLAETGYQVNLYTENYYGHTRSTKFPDYVSNVYTGKVTGKMKGTILVALNLLAMSYYRSVPILFKMMPFFQFLDSNYINKQLSFNLQELPEEAVFSTDMDDIYQYVTTHEFKVVNENVYSFIHLAGCHKVMTSYGAKVNAVRKSFAIIDLYLDALKKAGVYDNATIIITGDHSNPYSNNDNVREPRLTAFYLKTAHSTNETLQVSDAPTSHQNIWATIFQSEEITTEVDYGLSVQAVASGATQTRTVIWDYWTYGVPWVQATWQINGLARDLNNWTLIDRQTFSKGM